MFGRLVSHWAAKLDECDLARDDPLSASRVCPPVRRQRAITPPSTVVQDDPADAVAEEVLVPLAASGVEMGRPPRPNAVEPGAWPRQARTPEDPPRRDAGSWNATRWRRSSARPARTTAPCSPLRPSSACYLACAGRTSTSAHASSTSADRHTTPARRAPLKTARARRDVLLQPALAHLLRSTGSAQAPFAVRRLLHPAVKKLDAGKQRLRFHDLRHTYTSADRPRRQRRLRLPDRANAGGCRPPVSARQCVTSADVHHQCRSEA
jgi:hypothetical protein